MEYGDDAAAYDIDTLDAAAADIASSASTSGGGSFACCALCGSVNVPGDTFCGECGHKLEDEAPVETAATLHPSQGTRTDGLVMGKDGDVEYGTDINAYELAGGGDGDGAGANQSAAAGYGADDSAYELAAEVTPAVIGPRKKGPPPAVAPRKKKAPVALPEATYGVAEVAATNDDDDDGDSDIESKASGYIDPPVNAYELATTTDFPAKPSRGAKKKDDDAAAAVGYGNDTNAYEMATAANFPIKPDRRKGGGDGDDDGDETIKASGYGEVADYEMASVLEGAGGMTLDSDTAAGAGAGADADADADAEAMPQVEGSIAVSIPAARVVEAHSHNDEYSPEHAGQEYVASLGVVLGIEGGAAGEAANADEGTFAGVYITGLRAAAAATAEGAGAGAGLAVGQRVLAINGVNMMSEPLATVVSVMGGTVVFAVIGMPNSIELMVLPDPDGFEGIPIDTKAAASAAAAAAAIAATNAAAAVVGGGGGGDSSGGGSSGSSAKKAASKKQPAGVWLKKKAEGIGRSKKRYFTLSKGTVNIPPVFWYWEHCDQSGNGHTEKGSIQLVAGCSATFDGKVTISITTPDRAWGLIADKTEDGSVWTKILNDELDRVAGRDAAEVAAASGQKGGAASKSVAAGAVASDMSAYSSVTVAMLATFTAEQRTSILEAVKRGRITMLQLLQARKIRFSGNRFVGLGEEGGVGKIDIASAMSLKLLSKFNNDQRLIILTAIKNGEVTLEQMSRARRIAFIEGKLVLGTSKSDDAFITPAAKRNADLAMLKRFTAEQRIAILKAVAAGKLTVNDLIGSRRIKVEKDGTVTVSSSAPANGMLEFCPKCRARAKEGRRFCTGCGGSLGGGQ